MRNIEVEYYHTTLNKVFSIDKEITLAEFYAFQESEEEQLEVLGFIFVRVPERLPVINIEAQPDTQNEPT